MGLQSCKKIYKRIKTILRSLNKMEPVSVPIAFATSILLFIYGALSVTTLIVIYGASFFEKGFTSMQIIHDTEPVSVI